MKEPATPGEAVGQAAAALAKLAKAADEAQGGNLQNKVVNWRKLAPFVPEKLGDLAAAGELDGSTGGMGAILGTEPTPELAAQVADECEHLLAQLDDDAQRQIALLKLEGYTDQEISDQLGCGLRTVQRKLARIRDKWAQHR